MAIDFAGFAQRTGLRRRLTVIAPHPDDETLGCGGLIALARTHGVSVRVIVVTDGAASHKNSSAFPRERLIATRKAELADALAVLGVDLPPRYLDLPDSLTGSLAQEQRAGAASALIGWLEEDRPDCVAVTWRREPHCDHRFASQLAREACQLLGLSQPIEYQIWTPLIGGKGDAPKEDEAWSVEVDITMVHDLKLRAVRKFASQLGLIRDDPEGFCLQKADLSRLVTMTERFEVSE